jgi:hypothetical protein
MAVVSGRFRFGQDSGHLYVRTKRVGLAARAGHDLTLEVTRWSAEADVPAEDAGGLAAATITAEADLGSLTAREGTGGALPLSSSDRAEIDATARRILAGSGRSTASFSSARILPLGAGGAIEGTLTIRGTARPFRLQVMTPAPGRYRGTGTVTQSSFGIKPYTAFFGALKLRDEVEVEFEVDLTRAELVTYSLEPPECRERLTQ